MQKINIYLNGGGLGDRIAAMPAVLYALKYHNITMDLIVPDYFVPVARHFLRGYEERATVLPMSTLSVTLDKNAPSVVMQNNYVTTLRRHLVDHAFDIINDNSSDVPLKAKHYPKLRLDEIEAEDEIGCDYVVLTPGFTAPVRALPARTWNQIAKWLVKRDLMPVWIGAKADTVGGPLAPPSEFVEGVDYSIGIDLRDKTSILGAGKIIALAKAIVGVDNGLLHLAGTTETPIIAGFTSVDPKTRAPYRHEGLQFLTVTPPDWMECKFRQTRTHYDYQTDFRTCPCGTECVESLTAEKFIIELEKVV